MSYDENDARAEYYGTIHAGRKARAKAKALKKIKSPEYKKAKENARKLTKEGQDMYWWNEKNK